MVPLYHGARKSNSTPSTTQSQARTGGGKGTGSSCGGGEVRVISCADGLPALPRSNHSSPLTPPLLLTSLQPTKTLDETSPHFFPLDSRGPIRLKLPAFWKSVEVKASTSEHNASRTTVRSTLPSTSPLRHLISITSPRPMFSTLPPYRISIIVWY
ncbi:hypothetical protein E2C01_039209 [Portunus trituberculatus]|uniref:Uncharacterized protein n=1 Tax=Portunus trituberculatus TaxID=210409 RepID=A0A5B7FKR4_PORTR|nr:hypothetical protein [Portunus trituberculatus]